MWRTIEERTVSAGGRLALAAQVWHWEPHSQQRRFFCCPAQVRIAACGRRWGKTEALSIDVASLALAEARAGRDCRQLVVAPTDAQARLLGNEILSRLLLAFEAHTEWTDGLELDVRQRPSLQLTVFPLGADPRVSNDKKAGTGGPACARIVCRTAGREGASLRGLWAHRIVCDEAGLLPDVVLTEVLLPMLVDVGGEYALASSPHGRRSAFYRLFAKGTDSDGVSFQSFQCPTSDNPHNDQALLASMREEMGDATFRQEILAEFGDDAGAVFREDDLTACLADDGLVRLADGDLLSDPRPGRVYSAGIDWGRRLDFSVCAVLDATESPARLVSLQRWQGASWGAQVHQVAATLARFAPYRVLADGNSLGDPLIEALTDAVRRAQAALARSDPRYADPRAVLVERFLFSPDSKYALVDSLNLGLSGRRLTYPHHRALLAELRGFEYGTAGSSGRSRMAARGSGHDDIVMALALAYF